MPAGLSAPFSKKIKLELYLHILSIQQSTGQSKTGLKRWIILKPLLCEYILLEAEKSSLS